VIRNSRPFQEHLRISFPFQTHSRIQVRELSSETDAHTGQTLFTFWTSDTLSGGGRQSFALIGHPVHPLRLSSILISHLI
jgi:hypothetical protein